MTQIDWLTSYISSAFSRVTLEDGVDIFTARNLDDYGMNASEKRLALYCQRGNWKEVDPQILRDRAWALTFLDRKGFRFYLPVILIDIIHNQTQSDLAETMFYRFSITPDGNFDGLPFHATFNRSQRAAIVRFLKYLRYNAGWSSQSMAEKLLRRIQERAKLNHTAL